METFAGLIPDLFAWRVASGLFVKATLLVGGAWLAAACLRRRAASTRYAVWTAAFVMLLLLPLATAILPKWSLTSEIPAPVIPGPATVPVATTPVSAGPATPASGAHHQTPDLITRTSQPANRTNRVVLSVALALWAGGVVFGLGVLAAGAMRVRSLRRHALVLGADEPAAALAAEIGAELGLTRPVTIALSSDLRIPVNWGVRRPIVLLPVEAVEWSSDRLRVVLLHELAHILRFDYIPHLAMLGARAIYWPNPLIWLAARRASAEQERACDDVVLSRGTRPPDYARHLVDIARVISLGNQPLSGALAMAEPLGLAGRVTAILARGLNRRALGRRTTVMIALGATLAALPVAAFRLVGEGRDRLVEREALSRLASPDAGERAQAAWVLGNAGARRAVEQLVTALRDEDPQVRGVAAWALGETGDPAASDWLCASLDDPDAYVREMVVLALGTLGDREYVEHLRPLVSDPEMGVRGVLTETLRRLGGREAAVLLAGMARNDADPHARSMAINNLRLTDREVAIETLLDMVSRGDVQSRGIAIHNLAELADARAIPALTTVIATAHEPFLRGGAAWVLGRTGDPSALDGALLAMRDADQGVRVSAAYALGALGGPRAVSALLAATRDPVHQVRLASVESLQQIRHK